MVIDDVSEEVWLAELLATTYHKELTDRRGRPTWPGWVGLSDEERDSWIAAAEQASEVQSELARQRFTRNPTRPT